MANPVVEWAKDNPLLAAGAALGVVVVIMLVTGGGDAPEEASGGMGAAGVQAYYAAVANQAQAGAVIQTAQIKANAETNRALIAATYGLEAAKVTAGTDQSAIDAGVRVAEIQTGGAVQIAQLNANAQRDNAMALVTLRREELAYSAQQSAAELANRASIANLAATSRLGKAQRGAVYQAAITGQVVPVTYKQPNPGNSAVGIINAGANFLSSVPNVLGIF